VTHEGGGALNHHQTLGRNPSIKQGLRHDAGAGPQFDDQSFASRRNMVRHALRQAGRTWTNRSHQARPPEKLAGEQPGLDAAPDGDGDTARRCADEGFDHGEAPAI